MIYEWDEEPHCNPGDVLCKDGSDVAFTFSYREIIRVLRVVDPEFVTYLSDNVLKSESPARRKEVYRAMCQEIYDCMMSHARPFADYDLRLEDIKRSRPMTAQPNLNEDGKKNANKKSAADKKPAAEKKPPKYPDDAKIVLLNDKEGKQYGPNNNPKRSGSASAQRFALYKNGMTVKSAREAGVTTADIDWDVKRGFVKIG